jgi:hypothetical protein
MVALLAAPLAWRSPTATQPVLLAWRARRWSCSPRTDVGFGGNAARPSRMAAPRWWSGFPLVHGGPSGGASQPATSAPLGGGLATQCRLPPSRWTSRWRGGRPPSLMQRDLIDFIFVGFVWFHPKVHVWCITNERRHVWFCYYSCWLVLLESTKLCIIYKFSYFTLTL